MPSTSRVCAIHQPNLFPRLSTLAKLYAADVWVVLDDVQFTRRDYQHRARLGARNDLSSQQWLSLSVTLPNGRSTQIRDVRIVDSGRCRRRVEQMTKQHHGRGDHWAAVSDEVAGIVELMGSTDSLAEVATASTQALLRLLDWSGQVISSSDLTARTARSGRLADLALAVGATDYLCGTGGAKYLNTTSFIDHGLGVRYFRVPTLLDSGVWRAATRVSAIAAIAEEGPNEVTRQFSAHDLTSHPRPERF